MITDKERANILSNFLIDFHTAVWTHGDLAPYFKKMEAYSYSRTNGWPDEEAEEEIQERTLLNLAT